MCAHLIFNLQKLDNSAFEDVDKRTKARRRESEQASRDVQSEPKSAADDDDVVQESSIKRRKK
jgi:hypothetical protein